MIVLCVCVCVCVECVRTASLPTPSPFLYLPKIWAFNESKQGFLSRTIIFLYLLYITTAAILNWLYTQTHSGRVRSSALLLLYCPVGGGGGMCLTGLGLYCSVYIATRSSSPDTSPLSSSLTESLYTILLASLFFFFLSEMDRIRKGRIKKKQPKRETRGAPLLLSWRRPIARFQAPTSPRSNLIT